MTIQGARCRASNLGAASVCRAVRFAAIRQRDTRARGLEIAAHGASHAVLSDLGFRQ